MANNNQENLFKAFGLFIEAFRPYIVSLLIEEEGDKWPAKFVEVLSFDQKEKWNMGLRNGSTPETLIDFHHLKSFELPSLDQVIFNRLIFSNTIFDTRKSHLQLCETDAVRL